MTSQHPEAIRARARRAAVSERYVGPATETRSELPLAVIDGVVLIGSDAHYWPGEPSTAHRSFVALARDLAPSAIILNGDIMDGARISRWPAGDWVDYGGRPTVVEELAVAQERLREIIG